MSLLDTPLIAEARKYSTLPAVLGERALSREEIEEELTREGEAAARTPLLRISARHRRLAKLVASGAPTTQCALEVGLTPSRVSALKRDPSFMDLVAFFSLQADLEWSGLHGSLSQLAEETVAILHDRLEADPDAIETKEIIDIIKLTADRTGFAPKRVEEKTVTLNFGDRLDAARQRVKDLQLTATVVEETTMIEEEH